MTDLYEEIVKIRRSGGKAALATLIDRRGSTPAAVAAKMLVRSDDTTVGTIGGGCVEAEVFAAAKEVIKEERPRLVSFRLTEKQMVESGLICGGVMDVFIEPIVADPTVFIFGAGHVAAPLARLAKVAGFEVVVIDDRELFANPQRFPDARQIIVAPFEKAFQQIQPNDLSYLVIVTRGHSHDEQALEWACRTKARYVGMMGSRAKVATIFKRLRKRGIPEEALARVRSPIGLAIGAETPEEIAVSIVAE
ncbi:MAG: xanthine dehydrogenase, partial [Planctomycetes bacterium]|nr:xanthine dehydrogenase [Planctomycetota bacterium]